ncbi:MAG: RluA family pseudouridine synthase [Halanaerobium sp.]|nr:RluA family pseudouridine synthase [Halanaerobium sp.]
MEENFEIEYIQVEEGIKDIRLDKYLADKIPGLSRSYLQTLIKDGQVLVGGEEQKPSYRVSTGEEVKVTIPPPKEMELEPEQMELDILYEDEDLIVINKKPGLVVHPAPGNYDSTLVNALLYHCDDLSGIGGVQRPGIVHRLDKDTTGVIVVAKNDHTHRALRKQFKTREVEKKYLAVVHGYLTHKRGKIVAPIGRDPNDRKKMAVSKDGREAISIYQVVEELAGYSNLEIEIKTGRTHQIRVHLSYLNHPVVGDKKYSSHPVPPGINRQLLHAWKLSLRHPGTGRLLTIEAPIPGDMEGFLKEMRKGGR